MTEREGTEGRITGELTQEELTTAELQRKVLNQQASGQHNQHGRHRPRGETR